MDNPHDPRLTSNRNGIKVKIEPVFEEDNNEYVGVGDADEDPDLGFINHGWLYQMDDDPLQLKVEIQQSDEIGGMDIGMDDNHLELEPEIEINHNIEAEPELDPLAVEEEQIYQLDPLLMENILSVLMKSLSQQDLLKVRHVSQFWNQCSISEIKKRIWPPINFGNCEKNYSSSLMKQIAFEKMFLCSCNKDLFQSFEFFNLSSLKSFGHFIFKYSNMDDDYFTMKRLTLSIVEKNMKSQDMHFLLECLAVVSTTLVSLNLKEYFSNIHQDVILPLMFPNLENLQFKETESQVNENFHYIEQEMKNHCPHLFFSRIVETAPKLKSLFLQINSRENKNFAKYFDGLSSIAHCLKELELKLIVNILNCGFSKTLLKLAELKNGLRLKSFSLTINHVKHIEDSEISDQDIRDIMVYFTNFLQSQSLTLEELKLSISFYTFYDPKPYDKDIKVEEIYPLELLPVLPNLKNLYLRNQMETFKYRHGEENLFNPINLREVCPKLKHLEFPDEDSSEPPVFADQDYRSQLTSIKTISS